MLVGAVRWRPYAAVAAPLRNWLSLAISRDLCRAALFLWMTPLLATRSSMLTAAATAAVAVAWSPSLIAVSALRTKVRADVRYGLFRCRRRSATRMRFSADFLFAKPDHPSLESNSEGSSLSGAAFATPVRSYQKAAPGSRFARFGRLPVGPAA